MTSTANTTTFILINTMPAWPNPLPPLRAARAALQVRRAVRADVPSIVGLLVEDPITAKRETTAIDAGVESDVQNTSVELEPYYAAFEAVDADRGQLLAVIVDTAKTKDDGDQTELSPPDAPVIGTAQLTLIPGLTRRGATRLQIEGLHIADGYRGGGLGGSFFAWMDEVGRLSGASMAQLTSDRRRADAHRFYERLGWVDSHSGFKKVL